MTDQTEMNEEKWEIHPPHRALNNFRPFCKKYPWASNTMYDVMANNGDDDTVIAAGAQQIDHLLQPSPFEPEHYGFKMQGNDRSQRTYVSQRDNDTVIVLRKRSDLNNGLWSLLSRSNDGKKVYFPEFAVYIPNDMAARILFVCLLLIPRVDLGPDGEGCPNDDDKDGICAQCETKGRCIREGEKTENVQVETKEGAEEK